MCYSAYLTLTKLKIFSFYRLLGSQQTDANSILFCASYDYKMNILFDSCYYQLKFN